jgi:hypothetical protein
MNAWRFNTTAAAQLIRIAGFVIGGTGLERFTITSAPNGGAAQDGTIREFVLANHYMDSFAFHPISGRAIIHKFGYPQCSKK